MAIQSCFRGSRDAFLMRLATLSSYGEIYPDPYIIRQETSAELPFGIERCGHSGGYWYEPHLREDDGFLIFTGEIGYRGPDAPHPKKSPTLMSRMGDGLWKLLEWVFVVVLSPLILCEKVYCHFRPAKTREDRLDERMAKRLRCEKCPEETTV